MKWLKWILMSIVLWSCGEEKVDTDIIRPVRYVVVKQSDGTSQKLFSGTAKAQVEVNMSFKVSGTIDELEIDVGQKLQKDELIARLDETDYRLQYEQAVASLYQAKARKKNAFSNYERLRLLYENNNVALSDYESAEAQYESENANFRALNKQVELYRQQLQYCKLYAPFDGIVAEKHVEVNENVQAGQTIVKLSSGKGIEVKIDVPDAYIPYIKTNDTVKVDFSTVKSKSYEGRVTEVAYATGQLRTSYPVVVRLLSPDSLIRPGMTASVKFSREYQGQQSRQLVTVPAFAVGEDRDGNFVFVLKASGQGGDSWIAHKKRVEIGEVDGEKVQINSGVEEGDKIVTAGISRIEDGMTVRSIQ